MRVKTGSFKQPDVSGCSVRGVTLHGTYRNKAPVSGCRLEVTLPPHVPLTAYNQGCAVSGLDGTFVVFLDLNEPLLA